MSSAVVKTYYPASGITHSIGGRFFRPDTFADDIVSEEDRSALVLIKGNVLDLYLVKNRSSRPNPWIDLSQPASTNKTKSQLGPHLFHLHTAVLYGNPESIAAMPLPHLNYDCLVLGFEGMKLSIMTWDSVRFDWRTEQLFMLHRNLSFKMTDPPLCEKGVVRGKDVSIDKPIIRADPLGRCLAVLAPWSNLLFIMPIGSFEYFVQSMVKEQLDSAFHHLIREDAIFCVDLESEEIHNAIDFQFVPGSYDPSVSILFSPAPTWAGRAILGRCATAVKTFCIDIRNGETNSLWVVDRLPFDAYSTIPIPGETLGGLVVVSPNCLFVIRHGLVSVCLVLNQMGQEYLNEAITKPKTKKQFICVRKSEEPMELDGCSQIVLNQKTDRFRGMIIIVQKSGKVWMAPIPICNAADPTQNLDLKPIGDLARFNSLISFGQDLLFAASRWGDSYLVRLEEKNRNPSPPFVDRPNENVSGIEYHASSFQATNGLLDQPSPPSSSSSSLSSLSDDSDFELLFKKPRLMSSSSNMRSAFVDLPKAMVSFLSPGTSSCNIVVCDKLVNLGPISDIEVGPSVDDHHVSYNIDSKLDLIVTAGLGKSGCLGLLQKSIRPQSLTAFDLGEGRSVWAVVDPVRNQALARVRHSRNARRKEVNAAIRSRNEEVKKMRASWVDEALKTSAAASLENEAGNADNQDRSPADEVQATKPEGNRSEDHDSLILQRELERKVADQMPLEVEEPFEDEPEDFLSMNSFMFVNVMNPPGTVVLRVEEEVSKVQEAQVAFVSNAITVAAGNVLDNAGIVQVVRSGVKLLRGKRQAYDYMNPHQSHIIHAEIGDPFILIQLASGTCIVLKAELETQEPAQNSTEAVDGGTAVAASPPLGNDGMRMKTETNESSLIFDVDLAEEQEQAKDNIGKMRLVQVYEYGEGEKYSASVQSCTLYHGPFADSVFPQSEVPPIVSDIMSEITDSDYKWEEEERFLYGLDRVHAWNAPRSERNGHAFELGLDLSSLHGGSRSHGASDNLTFNKKQKGTMLAVLTKTGALELRHSQDFRKIVFRCARFFQTPRWLDDDGEVRSDVMEMTKEGSEDKEEAVPAGTDTTGVNSAAAAVAVTSKADKTGKMSKKDTPAVLGHVFMTSIRTSSGHECDRVPILIAVDQQGVPYIYRGYVVPSRSKKRTRYAAADADSRVDLSLRSRLRFVRILAEDVPANMNISTLFTQQQAAAAAAAETKQKKGKEQVLEYTIVPFENVGGRGGIFVCGPQPFFILAERGLLRLHPFYPKSSRQRLVFGFAQLHNISCSHGFVYVSAPRSDWKGGDSSNPLKAGSALGMQDSLAIVSSASSVSICMLPPLGTVTFETPWPTRKIDLKVTPHKIALHQKTEAYGVLVATTRPTNRSERASVIKQMSSFYRRKGEEADDDDEEEGGGGASRGSSSNAGTGASAPDDMAGDTQCLAFDHDEFMPTLEEEIHEFRVYRKDSWEIIDRYELKPFEMGLCVKYMTLDVYKASTGMQPQKTGRGGNDEVSPFAASVKMRPKNMLVVGTGYAKGEEVGIRGRILMFEVSRQDNYVGEQLVSTFQVQLIAEKELKGPASSLAALEGYVLVGVGSKLEVYKLVEDDIVCCSFMFGDIYTTSLATMKNYVLCADMFKSVSFYFWRNRNKSMNFLSKGHESFETSAVEFLLFDTELGALAADLKGNFQLLHYSSDLDPDARGGTRLVPNGAIQVGSQVNALVRVRDSKNLADSNAAGRHVVFFATSDGSVGAVIPLRESQTRMVSNMTNKLAQMLQLPRYAGLNPRSFHAFNSPNALIQVHQTNLADAHVAGEYRWLDRTKRAEIARQLGTSESEICHVLSDMDSALLRF